MNDQNEVNDKSRAEGQSRLNEGLGIVLSFAGDNERDSGSVTIHDIGVISMSHGICEAIKKQFPNDKNFRVELRVMPNVK